MDDYLVLVLENQKRLPAVDPEEVKRKLEAQGAPGEVREEELRRVLTEVKSRENGTKTDSSGEGEQRTWDGENGGSGAEQQEKQEKAYSAPGEETGDGEQTEETRRKEALWRMAKTLQEERSHGKQTGEKETGQGSRRWQEKSEEASDEGQESTGRPWEEQAASAETENLLGRKQQKKEEETDTAGAREILRRLEAAEQRAGTKAAPEDQVEAGAQAAAERSGREITAEKGEEAGEWAQQRLKEYLWQMAVAVTRREEIRMVRVTEQTTQQTQTVSPQTGTTIPAYQTQWGEVDPEGLSRLFQRDARRYS